MACMHPRLRKRFILALICAILLAPLLLAIALFGTVSLLLLWIIAILWIAREILYVRFVGNSILVSDLNYPRILGLSNNIKNLLDVRREFSIFVYEHGYFNAYMMRLFFRRAIFLNSEVLEAGVSDDEVRWLVGRFIGYWRVQQDSALAGRLIRLAQRALILNILMLPYERAMSYTGDRLGVAAIEGDITSAISAMQKLLVGRQLGYSVNPVGIAVQARLVKGSLFAFLARVFSAFPHTITRYVDLMAFGKRRYPEEFAKFDAANPGLPDDLEALSGERTSGRSIAKAFGFLAAIIVALGITTAIWAGLGSYMANHGGNGLAGLISSPSSSPADDNAPPPGTPPPPDNSAPAPQGGGVITNPVVVNGVADSDIAAAYPAAAKAGGVTGDVTVTCTVNSDGSMSGCQATAENPTGYGFGDVAVQLASRITIAAKAQDGSDTAGRSVAWDIPFKLSQ